MRATKPPRHLLLILCLTLLAEASVHAQDPQSGPRHRHQEDKEKFDDSDRDRHGKLHAYFLTPRVGDPMPAFIDTLKIGYHHRASAEGRSTAEAYMGNMASPYQSKIYFDRSADRWGEFYFLQPYAHLLYRQERMNWFDTKVPYTKLSYATTGSDESEEQNFSALFTTNLGKDVNIGGSFDIDYANGFYQSMNAKNVTYRLFGSYTHNRYELFLSAGNTNVVSGENGGLTDDRYITNPEDFTEGRQGLLPKDYPTLFQSTWNRIVYGSARLNHRYNIGFFKRDSIPSGDSILVTRTFVPVTRIFHDLEYEKGRRHFLSRDPKFAELYPDPVLPRPIEAQYFPDDRFQLTRISNTVGIQLLEGFHKWAKMGVAAFVSLDYKWYKVPLLGHDEEGAENLDRDEHTTYIGGRIASTSFKHFKYHVQGEVGVEGTQAGEVKIRGEIQTSVPIAGKEIGLDLRGELRNTPPPYLLRRYKGSIHEWQNDLIMSQSLRLGGTLRLTPFGTELKADVETIQNPLFANAQGQPEQSASNLRVYAIALSQKLGWRALHWDTDVVWQKSSNTTVAPLPDLSAYSTLYVQPVIAKVLTIQIGIDAKYHTAYHAPYYDPTTQLFRPQEEISIGGGIPLMTAFASAHLKRTRFYVSYYNVSALIGKPDYFSMPHYPLNPPSLRLGLIVDLRN